MRLIVCDRCRQEIRGVSKTGYVNLDKRDIATGVLEGNREFDEWDLCDDCLMQIRDFVHMAPLNLKMEKNLLTPIIEKQIKAADTERAPEPDPGKTEEPEPIDVDESHGLAAKPKRPKAGAHPKAELMKEMARSGASLTEIMEVAGCSEPTARKYMKEAQDE